MVLILPVGKQPLYTRDVNISVFLHAVSLVPKLLNENIFIDWTLSLCWKILVLLGLWRFPKRIHVLLFIHRHFLIVVVQYNYLRLLYCRVEKFSPTNHKGENIASAVVILHPKNTTFTPKIFLMSVPTTCKVNHTLITMYSVLSQSPKWHDCRLSLTYLKI